MPFRFTRGLINPHIEGRIGGKILPNHFLQHSWSLLGRAPNEIGQFVVHPLNLNETTISDGIATFSRSETSESLVISGRKLYFSHYLLGKNFSILAQKLKVIDIHFYLVSNEMSQKSY